MLMVPYLLGLSLVNGNNTIMNVNRKKVRHTIMPFKNCLSDHVNERGEIGIKTTIEAIGQY